MPVWYEVGDTLCQGVARSNHVPEYERHLQQHRANGLVV